VIPGTERDDRNGRSAATPASPATFATFASFAAFAQIIFLAFHFAYLPQSLEDLDSINFALGVTHFDVAQHQPHPPGYPVFIALAKALRPVASSETAALASLSVVSGALGVVAIAWLFSLLDRRDWRAWLPGTLIAMTAPIYWFTAVRPLSDMTGLAAAIGIQALTLSARTPASFATAALLAGIATGVRSQVAWLTIPLLIVRGLGERGTRGLRTSRASSPSPEPSVPQSASPLVPSLMAFAVGVLIWLVPLVAITGGPVAYWRALSNQGAEDLGNITMLWTKHDPRTIADAVYYALIAPWATWTVASVVIGLAALGIVWLWRWNRIALALLIAAFGPYFVFDLLFQETFTSRYALPLVVPMAYFAAAGTRWLPREAGVVVAIAIAMFDAHIGGTSIAAFARQKAPAFRLLEDMAAAAASSGAKPVIAMDRRNSFDFRRPIVWAAGSLPPIDRTLPAPPQHEWLEAMRYWNSGGRAPVWFVVDPKRTSIDLVQHGEPMRYRWPLPYPVLVSGARPDEMDWYRVERPEWYVGEGWALTPEAAGVAAADRRGLAYGPIHAGVLLATEAGGVMMIGGRSFDPAARPRLTATIDGDVVLDETLMPGPFLRFIRRRQDPIEARGGYAALTIVTTPPAPVAIEQFDASVRRPLLGFGAGWHEQEFNPATGVRWRWLSERGELKVISSSIGGDPPAAVLHVEGESPRKYFSKPSHLTVRSGGRVYVDRLLADDFAFDVPLETATDTIVFETDQVYAPADRSRRTQDRRHLGLRIYTCAIR
jgi:hypothetical protein